MLLVVRSIQSYCIISLIPSLILSFCRLQLGEAWERGYCIIIIAYLKSHDGCSQAKNTPDASLQPGTDVIPTSFLNGWWDHMANVAKLTCTIKINLPVLFECSPQVVCS